MFAPHIKQPFQEGRSGEHAGLVQLFLPQVRVGVHGLHESAHRVQCRVGARRTLTTKRTDHTGADPLAKPV